MAIYEPVQTSAAGRTGKRIVPGAPIDPDAFLEWLKAQPEGFKYELSNGTVTEMMVWVTRAHWIVTRNLLKALLLAVDGDRFLAGPAEFGVRTPFGVRFPDVLVVPPGGHAKDLAADDAVFVAEVLSTSSISTDFLEKLPEYKAIESLAAYLILSQDVPHVWLWARDDARVWPAKPTEIVGIDGSVPLPALGVELPMADLFQGVPDASGASV